MTIKRSILGLGLGIGILLLLVGCTGATSGNEAGDVAEPERATANDVVEAGASVADTGEDGVVTGANVEESRGNEEDAVVEAETQEKTTEGEAVIEKELLAGTNIARHSVPLEEIYIDTFNGSAVRVSEATEEVILRFRDAIPPIENPKYTDVETADSWLAPDDTVVGYVDGDVALAYPTKILNYHEIVNEKINDKPVLISYCPLCNSGIVYDRRVGDQVLEFGNTSGLYQSDMVMYDRQTFSYWFQVEGSAIVGDLTGQQMEVLPTRFMRWAEWRETYPNSQVLSRDTGFDRPYDRDPFVNLPDYLNRGRFAFPVSEEARNPALPAGEQVVSLVIDGEARAYSLEALAGSVVNDEVGGVPVAVAVDEAGTATVLERRLGDQVLTLAWDGELLVAAENDTLFDLSGKALDGPLQGETLDVLPARFSFWFAFVAAFPEGTAYQP